MQHQAANDEGRQEQHEGEPDPIALLKETLQAFITQYAEYLSLQKELISAKIRNAVLGLAAGVLGLFLLFGLVVAAISAIFRGAAMGLQSVLGLEPWVAWMSLGGGVLFLFLLVIKFTFAAIRRKALQAAIERHGQSGQSNDPNLNGAHGNG